MNLALDDTGSARLGFLRSLSVPGNQIASLAGLLAFPCLESLDIGNNGVRFDDIQAFTSTLTCLESLSIEGNPRPIPAEYVYHVCVSSCTSVLLFDLPHHSIPSYVSVLKTALPSLETLDSKPIVEVAGSVGEFGLRPGTASGVRPGSSAGQRRPSTPSTQTGPFTLGRPPSSASLRPSSAAGQRPTTPSFGDGSAGSPRSARPTMKTSLSKSGALVAPFPSKRLLM